MPCLSLPRLPLRAGHRGAKLSRATARAAAALARLAPLLDAEVERQAERGQDPVGTWGLLCQVEALLASLHAGPTARAAAPPQETMAGQG